MTVKELKDQLSTLDDSYKITLQMSDGGQKDITKASQQGEHFTFWADTAG